MKYFSNLIFITLVLFSLATTAQVYNDGPYILQSPHGKSIININDGKVETHELKENENIQVRFADHPDWDFEFKLHPIINPAADYPAAGKILALSDVEGEFESFRKLMIAAKVMDQNSRWIFGSGHLVSCGDLFDRGKEVMPFLWLLYKLEEQATLAGGTVHTILGNHDIMNLSGDLRYLDPKYLRSARLSGKNYLELIGSTSEIGKWLRSKNCIEKIGDRIYLHGGISPELIQAGLKVPQINQICRAAYGKAKNNLNQIETFLMGNLGPFWYRSYFMEPKIKAGKLDEILHYFSVSKIVVGHTIMSSKIQSYLGGKVIALDVNKHHGKIKGLLSENGIDQVISMKGKLKELKSNIKMSETTNIKAQTAVIFEPIKLAPDYEFKLPEYTKEIFIPVDKDVNLNGFLYEKPGNKLLMVYFQGNAKNLQNFLDNHHMVFDWGYNILVTDYRTFGKSEGQLNGQDQLYADAEKVYEYALEHGYKPEQIILYGYSMGAAMVSHLATIKAAKAVILESGYSSINEMDFSAGLCPAYELNNAKKAKQISMPTLIIHGEQDEIIPVHHAERIWRNLRSDSKKKVILAGGGHGNLRARPEYQQIINGFISQLEN